MKKHSLTMVFLLTVLFCLIAGVSGCDNLAVCDEIPEGDIAYDFNYLHSDTCQENNFNVQSGSNSDEGFHKVNDKTINVLNEMESSSLGDITYEDGNLKGLSSFDSMHLTFIDVYTEAPLYYGNAGQEISVLKNSGFNWDILASGNSYSDTDFGLLSRPDNYYPHEFDLPPVGMSVSGDYDDDAFSLKSSDKLASVDDDMVGKSMEESSKSDLDFEQIGVDAGNKAIDYFKSKDISFPKDYPYLYVLTSAGYVKIKGLKSDDALKGLLKALKSEFNKKHLKSVDDLARKDLIFYFAVVKNARYISYALKYDANKSKLIKLKLDKSSGNTLTHKSKTDDDGYNSGFNKDLNVTQNATDTVHAGVSDNHSNVSQAKSVAQMQVKSDVNPFNIIYTLIAILIVCAVFGVGYKKR